MEALRRHALIVELAARSKRVGDLGNEMAAELLALADGLEQLGQLATAQEARRVALLIQKTVAPVGRNRCAS